MLVIPQQDKVIGKQNGIGLFGAGDQRQELEKPRLGTLGLKVSSLCTLLPYPGPQASVSSQYVFKYKYSWEIDIVLFCYYGFASIPNYFFHMFLFYHYPLQIREFNNHKYDWGSLPCEGGACTCLSSTKTQRSRCFKSPGPCASWAGLHSQDRGPEQGHQVHLSISKPRVSKLASQNIKGKPEDHPSQTLKCLPPFGRSS